MDLQSDRARRRIHFFQIGLGAHGIRWIDQHGDSSGRGGQLAQQTQPLCRQLAEEKIDTSALPPGRLRLATRPSLTGSSPTPKTSGSSVVAALTASDAGVLVVTITF